MARIVLIDDDDLLRNIVAQTLVHAGHEVRDAADGKLGIDLVRAGPVDLVITDLIMPGQEGIETITILRRERPELPVIAMSGGLAHSKLYLEIASKIGARRILPKPFAPAQLIKLVKEVLEEAEAL